MDDIVILTGQAHSEDSVSFLLRQLPVDEMGNSNGGGRLIPLKKPRKEKKQQPQTTVWDDFVSAFSWIPLVVTMCVHVPDQYMPEDESFRTEEEEVSESKPSAVEPNAGENRNIGGKVHDKSAFATRLMCKPLDSTDRHKCGLELKEECLRILRMYAGMEPGQSETLNWVHGASKKGIEVFSATVPKSAFQAVKSTSVIPASVDEMRDLMMDDSRIPEYEETFDGVDPIETIDGVTLIRRYRYKPIWPTSARDFLICTTCLECPDGGVLVASTSPPDSYMPPDPKSGFVRGYIKCSGALIQPHPEGCEFTMFGHSDLSGSVPSFILNQLAVSIPIKTHQKLAQIFKKKRAG